MRWPTLGLALLAIASASRSPGARTTNAFHAQGPRPASSPPARRAARAGAVQHAAAGPSQGRHRVAPSLSLTAYRQAIHSIRLEVDTLASSYRPAGSVTLPRAVRTTLLHDGHRLRGLRRVRLPDGRVLTTDTPLLAGALLPANRRSLQAAAAAIDALDSAMRTAPQRPAGRAMLALLDKVLRDPRFQHAENPPGWLSVLVGFIVGAISRALQTVISAGFAASLLAALLLLAMVAALGYLIARGALDRMVVDIAPSSPTDDPVTSTSAGSLAAERVSAGDYRAALRYLYLSTMLTLQERGLLVLRADLTNFEYLQSLAWTEPASASLRRPLRDLIERFEGVWYGHIAIDAGDYRGCEALADAVLAAAHKKQEAA